MPWKARAFRNLSLREPGLAWSRLRPEPFVAQPLSSKCTSISFSAESHCLKEGRHPSVSPDKEKGVICGQII